MTGPRDVLDSDGGFYEAFSYYPVRGALDGLGRRWLTESLAIKRFPGCAYVDSAVDAMEAILERIQVERGKALDPYEIDSIRVHATVLTCEMERLAERYEKERLHPVLVNFSVRYSLAFMLLTGGLNANQMNEERIRELEWGLRSLAKRIYVHSDRTLNYLLVQSQTRNAGLWRLLREMGVHGVASVLRKASGQYRFREHFFPRRRGEQEPKQARFWQGSPMQWIRDLSELTPSGASLSAKRFSMEEVHPEAFVFPFGAKVIVRLKEGTTLTQEQQVPAGAPGNREKDLIETALQKFRDQATNVLGSDRAEEALKCLLEFGPTGRVRALVRTLVPVKRQVQ